MKHFLKLFLWGWMTIGCAVLNAQNFGIDTNVVDYANPQKYVIANTHVEGLESRLLDENSLIVRCGLMANKIITVPGEDFSKAIESLWKMRLFSEIEIRIDKILGDQIFLIVKVKELPKITLYSPEGVSKAERDDLREKWEIIGGVTPYNDYTKANIAHVTEAYFAEKGYLNAEVDVYAKPDTTVPNSVIVFIDVVKGYKVKIETIDFAENKKVTDRVLRKNMKDNKVRTQFHPFYNDPEHPYTKETYSPAGIVDILSSLSYNNIIEFLSKRVQVRIFSSSKYDPDKLRTDETNILTYYQSLGYRDVSLVRDSVYKISERDMGIHYTVNEGTQYFFRNITWKGNSKYTTHQLDSVLNIKKGDVYNQTLLNQRISFDLQQRDITSLYMDDGYLFFSVNPVEIWAENDSIDLEIRLREGPQATIDQIIIKGNTKTSEHVIRRELRTVPGQKFNRSYLIRSQREIAALGLFDAEQIGINPIPHPEKGTVDIEYTVVEKPSDQLELSAGYGGAGYGVLATVGIVLNNWSTSQMFKKEGWHPIPTGDGQKLSFRINTTGKLYQAFNIGFVEPWFGGKKANSLSVSLTRTQLGYNVYGSDIKDLEGLFAANGISLGYGIRLKWPDDYFTLLSQVSYYNYNLENYPNFITTNGNYNNFNFKETLGRTSIDDPQFPKTGSNISLSLQFTPPYSLLNNKSYAGLGDQEKYKYVEYYKWRFNAEWYTPLVDKFILRSSVKFGWLGFYNSDIGVPPFERFQLGGDGLSGGYTNSFIGTDIISLRGYELFSDNSGATRTEAIFNKYTLEIRYPITDKNPSAKIYALTFAEGGNLYPDFRSFNPLEVKRSVGLGVRAWLPMFGLLGVDYGIRFDDMQPGDLQESSGFFDYITKNGKFTVILGFEPE